MDAEDWAYFVMQSAAVTVVALLIFALIVGLVHGWEMRRQERSFAAFVRRCKQGDGR